MSLKQKIMEKAETVEVVRNLKTYGKDVELMRNTRWVKLSNVLALVSEREEKLQKLIEKRPKWDSRRIAWCIGNVCYVGTQGDERVEEWFVELEKELKP